MGDKYPPAPNPQTGGMYRRDRTRLKIGTKLAEGSALLSSTPTGCGSLDKSYRELCMLVYEIPKAAVTKGHRLDGLKQQEFILEARSPKSRCPRVSRLFEGSRGGSLLVCSRFRWLLAILGVPWHVAGSLQSLLQRSRSRLLPL